MFLVSIGFAGIAFAGPIANPPLKNKGLPIFLNGTNQFKIGTPASGVPLPYLSNPTGLEITPAGKVNHALSIGTSNFPYSDSTLYVEGTTTVGSLSSSTDITKINTGLQVNGSTTVNDTDPNDPTKQSLFTVIDIATTKNSNTIKSLCVDSTNKVVICSSPTPPVLAVNDPAITSFTKTTVNSTTRKLTWTSVNTTSCSLERIDPDQDTSLVGLVLSPNGNRNITVVSGGNVHELTCTNGTKSVTKYLQTN